MTDTKDNAPQFAAMDKVLPAISKAMASVKKVQKGGENTHDKYNFASIDDFLEMANPICAENGLIPHINEVGAEYFQRKGKYNESTWMRQTFAITLLHTSGQFLPTVTRSVDVLSNGAQSYGSAQSYVLKQYLRGLLLIATGDKDDADHTATDPGSFQTHDTRRNEPRQRSGPAPEAIDAAAGSLSQAETLDALKAIWSGLPKPIQTAPAVVKAKDKRKADLDACDEAEAKPALADDEIPY